MNRGRAVGPVSPADADRTGAPRAERHDDARTQWHELAFEARPRRLVSVGAAAEYLGVSRATVERLVYRGELAIVKVGGSTRYDMVDLDNYVETNRRRNRKRTA